MASVLVGCAGGDESGRTGSAFAGSGAGTTGESSESSESTGSSTNDNDLPPVDWDTDSATTADPPMTTTTGSDDTATDDESGSESSTGWDDPEVVHPCDSEFTVVPGEPTLEDFYVEVSNPAPLTWIGLSVVGPTTLEGDFIDVVADDPWVWRFAIAGHMPGTYVLEFSSAEQENGPRTVWSTCTLAIQPGEG